MKKYIKLILITIITLFSLFMISCGNKLDSTTNIDLNNENSSIFMTIGHTLSPESPRHQVLEEYKKRVEEKTNGSIVVELYHSNQVGDNNQLLQAVPLGNIVGAIQPTAFFGGVQNKLSVVDIPFIWEDMDHIQDVITSNLLDDILAPLEEKGIKGLALWPIGMKVITSNKPIDSFDKFSGQKFRTMGTPVLLETFSQWGTNPTPIPIPELYSSLQQGVVEGQENDIGTIHDLKLYEVQKYFLPVYHGAVIDVFYINKDWFESLTDTNQQIIMETARELVELKIKKELEVLESKYETIINSGKVEIHDVSDSLIEDLKSASEIVKQKFIEDYPDMENIINKISKN